MYGSSASAYLESGSASSSENITHDNVSSSNSSSSSSSTGDRAQSDRILGVAKRAQFHQHLLRALDLLACHYLLLVYLHDTSTYRLLLRGLAQTVFLSPRIARIRLPAVFNSRPILVILLGVNAYCVVAHALFSFPHAPALLHGGLTTEFIGDRPFKTATPFIVFDFAILLVQLGLFCLMFFPKLTNPVLSAESPITSSGTEEEEHNRVEEDEVVPDIYDYYTGTYALADLRLVDTLWWAWSAHLHEGSSNTIADVEAGRGRGPAASDTVNPETEGASDSNRSLSPSETISRIIRSLA